MHMYAALATIPHCSQDNDTGTGSDESLAPQHRLLHPAVSCALPAPNEP